MISRLLIFIFAFAVFSGALKPQVGYTFLQNPMFWAMGLFFIVCFFYFWVIPAFRFERENCGRAPVRHLISLSPILYLIPFLLMMWFSFLMTMTFGADNLGGYGAEKVIRFTFLTVPMCIVLPIIAKKPQDIYYYYYGVATIGVSVSLFLLFTLNPSAFGSSRYQSSGELIGVGIVILLPLVTLSRIPFTRHVVLLSCISFLMIPALFLSAARGAIIGVGIIGLINLWKSKGQSKIIQLSLLFIAVLSIKYVLPGQFIDQTLMRLEKGIDKYQLEGGRRRHINNGLELFAEHPILGVGIGGYIGTVEKDHPHNAFVEALCELGLFGGIAYIFAVGSGFQGIILSLKRQPNNIFYTTTFYIWVYTLLISMKSGDFNNNRAFWIINALGIYFQYAHRASKEEKVPKRNRVQKTLFAPNLNRKQLFPS